MLVGAVLLRYQQGNIAGYKRVVGSVLERTEPVIDKQHVLKHRSQKEVF